MKKTGEDQPPKASPSKKELTNLAGKKTKADQDTEYQDGGKGRGKVKVKS
jgi:hypothetical protein